MNKLTNKHNLPLPIAAWLAKDTYDHNDDPNTISVTTLIKPVKQTILGARVPPPTVETANDVMSLVASRVGTAVHDAVENTFKEVPLEALVEVLGYPKRLVSKLVVNPTKLEEDQIPLYMEQRISRKMGKWTVSGKFDYIFEGIVNDIKTTSVYTYINGNNTEKYILQGSIYRWLNPDIINSPLNSMNIVFIFKDWSAGQAKINKSYPPTPIYNMSLQLDSLEKTEAYIQHKVTLLEQLWNAPEADLPPCTDEDLWRKPTTYKYYKNPEKTTRSTANFDSYYEAASRLSQDGNVGIIKTIVGTPTACLYCAAAQLCEQKNQYIADGSLVL